MEDLDEKELAKYKNDIIQIQKDLDNEKIFYAMQLNSGLGETIKKELREPTKPKKQAVWRYKFNKLKAKIKDKFLSKKIIANENSLARFLWSNNEENK